MGSVDLSIRLWDIVVSNYIIRYLISSDHVWIFIQLELSSLSRGVLVVYLGLLTDDLCDFVCCFDNLIVFIFITKTEDWIWSMKGHKSGVTCMVLNKDKTR